MNYILTTQTESELYHHGVKGMKWGVRKEYEPHPRKKKRDNSDTNNQPNKKKGLTSKQKKALTIGVAAVGTVLAAYGGYKLYKTGKLDGVIDKGKGAFVGGKSQIKFKDGFQLQSKPNSINDNLKKVNPKFSIFNRKTNMNCGNCAIAFEARMRGYDVTARGNDTGMLLSQFGEFFKGFNAKSFQDVDIDSNRLPSDFAARGKIVKDSIKSTISKTYNGDARGTIFFTHSTGNHFISWDKKGKDIRFYDGQNPKLNIDNLFGLYEHRRIGRASRPTKILRLDDLELNTENLGRVVKNVSDKSDIRSDSFSTTISRGKDFITDIL